MLVPDALADVYCVARLPVDALLIQEAVALAAQNDDDRFVVLVGHRMGMGRVDVTVDFDDAVLKTELLRDQRPHPHPVLRLPLDLHVFAFDRLAAGFALGDIRLDPFRARLKERALAFKPFFVAFMIRHLSFPFLSADRYSLPELR